MKVFYFYLFVIVSLMDFLFTYNGIRKGFLEEKNFILLLLQKFSGLNIFQTLVISKTIAILLAAFLVFQSPALLEKVRKKVTFKILLWPEKILLILIVITTLFGMIPAMIGNVLYYFFEGR